MDVWSLGCTLFALLYGYSPFEPPTESSLVGDSIALAVTQGQFKFPDSGSQQKTGNSGGQQRVNKGEGYLDWGAKEVVRRCLVVDPEGRPDVREVREFVEGIIGRIEREMT